MISEVVKSKNVNNDDNKDENKKNKKYFRINI